MYRIKHSKKLLMLVLITNLGYAVAEDNQVLYGTSSNPQINGVAYDVHKTYIEANAGYAPKAPSSDNSQGTVTKDESQQQVHIKPVSSAKQHVQAPINFSSDAWASDTKVANALKRAASEGKLGYVLDQAKKSNVPASVAIVPMVESNYNKAAISPKGAGGAWQIMPGTAGDYGLSSKDRFDFNSSTNVAIQILNDLHIKFGNWALAFAAYNCGDTCVINALRKNPNATDIDQLSLPSETKQYVHKIVQLNQLIAGLDNGAK